MNIVLENALLRVEIATLGAELQSVVGKKSNFEYLWQGDPTFWQNRATVIFPICGRLGGGEYVYEGKKYEMCLHGFAKLNEFTVLSQSDTEVLLELLPNEEIKAMYPFDFAFRMKYTLDGKTIRQEYQVENTGKGDLPFSVGGHPGFNIPFVAGEAFEDYYLEFACAKEKVQKRYGEGFFYSGKTKDYTLRDGKYIDLVHSLFDNDAIFLEQTCKEVSLKSKKNDRAITVKFDDFAAIGFWHKPLAEAPYVCIEPWNGCPSVDGGLDDFATKLDMLHLDSGKTYTANFTITVTE